MIRINVGIEQGMDIRIKKLGVGTICRIVWLLYPQRTIVLTAYRRECIRIQPNRSIILAKKP